MINDPQKLIGKHIAWRTKTSIAHGTVKSLTMTPDVVLAETGYGKKRTISKVSISDIVKVYDDR